MTRVVVLGLDGYDWDIAEPWIKQGKLPNMKKLREEGTWGPLESTIPPLTCPAWPSFYTGKNPGKHGIFSFKHREKGSYELKIANSSKMKGETIWDILGKKGKNTYMVNFPLTYPPRKIKGGMVSGMLTPDHSSNYTYPKSLKKEINKVVGGYQLFPPSRDDAKKGNFLEEMKDTNEKRLKASKYLMENKDWDLFMVLFRAPDVSHHHVMKYHIGDCSEAEKKKKGKWLEEVYRDLDRVVGEIQEEMDEDDYLVIMSDHGGDYWKLDKPVKIFHVPAWLHEKGYLSIKGKARVTNKVNKIKIYNTLLKFGIDLKKILPNKTVRKTKDPTQTFKWEKSKAFLSHYSFRHGGITINTKEEEKGFVEEKDKDKVVKEIIKELKRVKDHDTGDRIIDKVWRANELYHGSNMKNSPDIIFRTKFNYTPRNLMNNKNTSIKKDYGGIHSQDGVYLLKGPGIKKGKKIKKHIMDIVPTILRIFGDEEDKDMDGKPIKEAFEV